MAITVSAPGSSAGKAGLDGPISVVRSFAGYSRTNYGIAFASYNDSGEAVYQDSVCTLSGQADVALAGRLSSYAFSGFSVTNNSEAG